MTPILGIMDSAKRVVVSISYWFMGLVDPYTLDYRYDNIESITTDTANNSYALAQTYNSSEGVNGTVIKFNNAGTIQWQRTFADSRAAANQVENPARICVDSGGNIYAAGFYSTSNTSNNGFLIKYNNSGTLQWQRSLSGSSLSADAQQDWLLGMTLDSSGNIYLCGRSTQSTSVIGIMVVKYNSSGTLQWQKAFADGPNNIPNSIALDASGNIYVCGKGEHGTTAINAILLKLDSSGTLLWQKSLTQNPAALYDQAVDVGVDSSGNAYILGTVFNSSYGTNAFLAKYNSSGTLQWQRLISNAGGPSDQTVYGNAINVSSSNEIYIIGIWTDPDTGIQNGFLMKYNSSGTLQWQNSIVNTANDAAVLQTIYTDSTYFVTIGGAFGDGSGNQLASIIQVPQDGSKTGTYSPLSSTGAGLVYSTGSLVDSAGALSAGTVSLSAQSYTLVSASGTFTDASGNMISTIISA